MKKVVLSLAVVFAVAMVSCGGAKTEAQDSDSVVAAEVVEEVVDSADTTVVVAGEVVEAPVDSAK